MFELPYQDVYNISQALFISHSFSGYKTRVNLEVPQAHIRDADYLKLLEDFGDKVQISTGFSQ
jgi:hypothetical protein